MALQPKIYSGMELFPVAAEMPAMCSKQIE